MFKELAITITVCILSIPSAQASQTITPAEAQTVGQGLIEQITDYLSAHPERTGELPEIKGTRVGQPVLIHRYPRLEPSYYVVPALNLAGRITCLIGTSAERHEWQWFRGAQSDVFPQVDKNEAHLVCERLVSGSTLTEPRLVEMADKKIYWLCRTDADSPREILVNMNDQAEIHTNEDADFSSLTTATDLRRMPVSGPQSGSGSPPAETYTYPEYYDIPDVPHYYQETSWYCGEAALKMVFDYWGEQISQTDIGDVANEDVSYGTYDDDLRRASHFSYISTAIQNPSLQGYNERDLGYSSCEVWWSDAPHYDTRYEDFKELVYGNYPLLVLTWYSSSHSSGHFRVIKGYDDRVNFLVAHDPWYMGTYQGPDVHFSQTFFVDNLWEYSGRWGLLSAPWQVSVSVPPVVGVGQTFDVGVSFLYTAPHPFEEQFTADNTSATISLPPGYTLISPATIDFGSHHSGSSADSVWQVLAPADSSDDDTIRVEVKGHVNGYCGSYGSYEDWIGGQGQATTATIEFACGDANMNQLVDLSDAIYILNYLYKNGSQPVIFAAADVNLDMIVNVADAIYLLNYLFKEGPAPCE